MLAALAGATGLAAQRELIVQNLTRFARAEGVAVVVPFAAGTVADLPALHVAGTPTAWQPFGARWPDGSLRQALCLFAVQFAAMREGTARLEEGKGPDLPTSDIALPTPEIEFVVQQGGKEVRATPVRVRDLEHNALRRVELRTARVPGTGLVVELRIAAWRDQPHSYVDVAVFFSDPTSKAMQCHVDELAIECRGMALLLRHAGRFGMRQASTATGSRAVLLAKNVLGDGQGLRRTGVLVPALRGDGSLHDQTIQAACVAPLLGACDWSASAAFGAFGLVPELPPWLQGERVRGHLAARHRAFVSGDEPPGDPFVCPPLGLAKYAGQTGDQFDFGVVKLSVVARSGIPSMLLEAEASVLQEACRPVHFFEADGSPVAPSAHPQWVVWSGRTHWHGEVSKDRLGKPVPEPQFETHGWSGKDREHWSSNHLGAYALLTGEHWARDELANEARLYVAGQTVDPALSTSHAGAPRGSGRTELAATWAWLATGDPALLERIGERIDKVCHPQWAGRTLPADRVRPMAWNSPDPRMLQGKAEYWNPWQDAIAAVGFAAAHRITGNPNARQLAEELAINVVRHGWLLTDRDCSVAVALRWQDGRPLRADELADPGAAHWTDDFCAWAVPACEIARVAAEARGDKAVAERAAQIQSRVRAGRRPPPPGTPAFGGIDRLAEWDAVRWQ